MWKPHMHLIGVVVDGVGDAMFLTDATTPKDANCATTCISRGLEIAAQKLRKRGLSMPEQLHIRSDNGNAEAKNQTVMKWAAWMSMRDDAFACVTLGQFRPGHAHFRADQRFSVASGVMANHNETLQDPEAFQEVLQKGIGEGTRVEYINKVFDWKTFFEPWAASFHGHTQNRHQTERGERAVHVFKFIQRRRLAGDMHIKSEFNNHIEDPRDCVLLTKAFLASTELSQQDDDRTQYKWANSIRREQQVDAIDNEGVPQDGRKA